DCRAPRNLHETAHETERVEVRAAGCAGSAPLQRRSPGPWQGPGEAVTRSVAVVLAVVVAVAHDLHPVGVLGGGQVAGALEDRAPGAGRARPDLGVERAVTAGLDRVDVLPPAAAGRLEEDGDPLPAEAVPGAARVAVVGVVDRDEALDVVLGALHRQLARDRQRLAPPGGLGGD